ncbi:MAG TPA: SRPBCC family protein, partial [Kofleriaceae bacterium]
RPRHEVFEFFANAENLEKLTPPSLSFHILSPTPIEMKRGARIDYRIKLQGVPMKWRTKIEAYEPEERFIDIQEKGPYKTWHHTHTFRDVPGGTEIRDRVEYELPLGPLGAIAHALFVKRQLRGIFDYRVKVMRDMFGVSSGS